MDRSTVPDITRIIVDTARSLNYIGDSLAVAPELVDVEKPFLAAVAVAVRERAQATKVQALGREDVEVLFVSTYANACEVACAWHHGGVMPELDLAGLFTGGVPCRLRSEVFDYFNSQNLPSDLGEAFLSWADDNPDYCTRHHVHPILPLLEALKWTYRISLSMVFDYLE